MAKIPRPMHHAARDPLQELQSAAVALTAESSDIDATIEALNAMLSKLDVPLQQWLLPNENHYQLGYAEVEGKWQLALRHCAEIRPHFCEHDDPEDDHEYIEPVPGTRLTVIPLLQASRELKIQAEGLADILIDHLREHIENYTRHLRDAKALAGTLSQPLQSATNELSVKGNGHG